MLISLSFCEAIDLTHSKFGIIVSKPALVMGCDTKLDINEK